MALAAKLRRAPVRMAAGAYILNSGVNKLSADEGTATWLHSTAADALPVLKRVPPTVFAKVLAAGEIAVIGFGGVLTGMYVRTPAWHDRYLRPTPEGVASAKDVWLLGAGVGLLVDAALTESPITATE